VSADATYRYEKANGASLQNDYSKQMAPADKVPAHDMDKLPRYSCEEPQYPQSNYAQQYEHKALGSGEILKATETELQHNNITSTSLSQYQDKNK